MRGKNKRNHSPKRRAGGNEECRPAAPLAAARGQNASRR